jgi:signal transduction histidine kinase
MTEMTGNPEETAAGQSTASLRRDGEIREALEHDQDQAAGTIDSERRDARQAQDRTDTQRRDAREAQELIDVRADTQRRDAHDAQERIDVRAGSQRRDARDAQERIDVRADTQRRDAHNAQERIDVQADTQRRDARTAQDEAEAVQDTERRDAQDRFDARRDGERREAFERTVTDQQRAGDLEQANQSLEAFAFSVSHDLRAPLRAIDGYTAALLEDFGPILGEEGRGYAGRIQSATQQMTDFIAALLRLARLSRADIRLQPVDLGVEVAAIAEALQAATRDRHVEFAIQQPCWAMADRVLIRTVLQNLLDNAWKFTADRDRGSIEFGTTKAMDGLTHCYVRDNGAGFDPALQVKLFIPFQRLHTARAFPGTGVGLASVRQIVERHGGRVAAAGSPGQGATFSFTLAAAEPA